jgi:phosphohistidine phosphatase
MKLYVMRHGPAEDHSPTGRDEDRALTASGRDRVRTVTQRLTHEKELPSRILSSGLVRAEETADIVAAAAGLKVETRVELAPNGHNLDLVAQLVSDGKDGPVLVGHEPDLSSLIEQLLRTPMPVPMDKAMVVALDVTPGPIATLRFILDPWPTEIVHDHRFS